MTELFPAPSQGEPDLGTDHDSFESNLGDVEFEFLVDPDSGEVGKGTLRIGDVDRQPNDRERRAVDDFLTWISRSSPAGADLIRDEIRAAPEGDPNAEYERSERLGGVEVGVTRRALPFTDLPLAKLTVSIESTDFVQTWGE